jgi:protein-tyrosine-phosphatase
MKIHFVCKGNTFRSRVAEAYLKSKRLSNVDVTSSGTEAQKNLSGDVCEYTVRILDENNIRQFLSKKWRVTNKDELEKQDLVVFMDEASCKYCLDELGCNISDYEIWDTPDIPESILDITPFSVNRALPSARITYEKIKTNADKLLKEKVK